MNNEPLLHYAEKIPFHKADIHKITVGKRYVAVLLKNGKIGVCATLDIILDADLQSIENIDLQNIAHRILYNAYLNAKLNYQYSFDKALDIFDAIDFETFNTIVMIGLFSPLTKKFRERNIPLVVFDKMVHDEQLTGMEYQREYLQKADAVILSATTMHNRTFQSITEQTYNDCRIFLLGPSSIIDNDMFSFKNITGIFGLQFEENDHRVLDVIGKGLGTKSFSKFAQKVYLAKP